MRDWNNKERDAYLQAGVEFVEYLWGIETQ